MLARLRKQESGFTLMELIVVIAILGIIASIAVPSVGARKKDIRDSQAIDTARMVANIADIENSRPGLSLDRVAKHRSAESLTKGTVVGMKVVGSDYCLTAWHPDGTRDASEPFVYDSTAKGIVIAPTATCASLDAIEPAYVVNRVGKLERMVPATTEVNVCAGVIPSDQRGDMYGTTTAGEYVELEANTLALSPGCWNVGYDIRVKNAVKGKTYDMDIMLANISGGGSDSYTTDPVRVSIVGTASTEGTIPTGWAANHANAGLRIQGGITPDKLAEGRITWTKGL